MRNTRDLFKKSTVTSRNVNANMDMVKHKKYEVLLEKGSVKNSVPPPTPWHQGC